MSDSKPSGPSTTENSTTPPVHVNRRRSTRVWHQAWLEVRIFAPGGTRIDEQGQTFGVNAHGGLLTLPMEVQVGQPMELWNPATQMEARCRVVRIDRTTDGVLKAAFEFDHPAPTFWAILHPPDDWGIRRS